MTSASVMPSPAQPRQQRSPALAAGLALLAYLAFNLLLPFISLPPRLSLLAIAALVLSSTAAFMLLQLWLAWAIAAVKPRPLVSGLSAVSCAAVWTLLLLLPAAHAAHPPFFIPFGQSLAVALGCTFLGILLSPIIREPNVLLPVALVAMPIDYLGAMTAIGFTQNIVAKHPEVVRHVSVAVPGVGSATHHNGLHPLGFIGPGDILFVAFFFAVVLRLNLNLRGTFWGIYGLLTLTMLFVLSPWGFNIAALVPMGLAVLIANFRYFRLKREEVFATLYAGLLIIALVTGFYFYSHSRLYQSDSKGIADAPRSAPVRPAPRGLTGN